MIWREFYVFGDTASKGFGATIEGHDGLSYQGWNQRAQISKNCAILVKLLRKKLKPVDHGIELFLFIDNAMTESCFYKGSSSSKALHALVLRLQVLGIEHNLTIHVIHISGTRMIAQGTEGCSCGFFLEGVMADFTMLSFVELAKTAMEQHPLLFEWKNGTWGGAIDKHSVWILEHESGGKLYLWSPAPAVADVAMEEFVKNWHKCTDTFHVVVVPRLLTPQWRHLFNKVCDFTFVVSPNHSYWPSLMYGPLWVDFAMGSRTSTDLVNAMQGIFCANFCNSQDGWPPCLQAWHAECYSCLGKGIFMMVDIQDELGNTWFTQETRAMQLNGGVKGAHICVSMKSMLATKP
ncbi:hypothetical protein ACHAXS_007170 [Conticribra weissflogii]